MRRRLLVGWFGSVIPQRIKTWIGDLLAINFEDFDLEIMPRGQATMRLALKEAGANPDGSWCLGQEKEFPDLMLEIFVLGQNGSNYERLSHRRLLPQLDLAPLERCARMLPGGKPAAPSAPGWRRKNKPGLRVFNLFAQALSDALAGFWAEGRMGHTFRVLGTSSQGMAQERQVAGVTPAPGAVEEMHPNSEALGPRKRFVGRSRDETNGFMTVRHMVYLCLD